MVRRLKAGVVKRSRQGLGKLRRLVNSFFRRESVAAGLQRRRGQCRHCGACCRLLFRCPLLGTREDGSSFCRIYRSRPAMCSLFPLDEKCLADRDLASPGVACGYRFMATGAPKRPRPAAAAPPRHRAAEPGGVASHR
jgi:hypothetical protein